MDNFKHHKPRVGTKIAALALASVLGIVGVANVAPDTAYAANTSLTTQAVQQKIDLSSASISGLGTQQYINAPIKPNITVTLNGQTLTANDYTVSYTNNRNVGTATVTVKGKGNYTGTTRATFDITEGNHPGLTMTATTPNAHAYSTKDFVAGGTVRLTGKKGTVTYTNVSSGAAANFTVNSSTGKVTVPANTPAGSYAVTIKATDDGGKNYLPATAEATMTITIAGGVRNGDFSVVSILPNAITYKTSAQNINNNFRVGGAKGKVTYKNVSTTKELLKFKVNSTNGNITIPAKMPVGTYNVAVDVTDAGDSNYQKTVKRSNIKVTITQGSQHPKVTAKNKTLKASSLKKKAASVGKVTVKGAVGSKTFSISGSKHFTISSKGAIKAAKGTPKGTYKLKVKVTAAGDKNVKAGSDTDTLTVKVK